MGLKANAIRFQLSTPLFPASWGHCSMPLPSDPLMPTPSPWHSLIYFLSVWICLFWTFPTDAIRQEVVFCD